MSMENTPDMNMIMEAIVRRTPYEMESLYSSMLFSSLVPLTLWKKFCEGINIF